MTFHIRVAQKIGIAASAGIWLSVCFAISMAQAQTPMIIADKGDVSRVQIIPADDPSFDTEVRHSYASQADQVLKLKPYIVIVRNTSKHAIAAYDVTWSFTRHEHKFLLHNAYQCPEAVAGSESDRPFPLKQVILPGQQEVIGPRGNIGVAASLSIGEKLITSILERQNRDFADVKAIVVGTTAVFDDGIVVQTDRSTLPSDFLALVNAKQEIYKGVVAKVKGGASPSEVFASLDSSLSNMGDPQNPAQAYSALTVTEILRYRNSYSDTEVYKLIVRAVRATPFTLKQDISDQG